jgi:hypothetical protein
MSVCLISPYHSHSNLPRIWNILKVAGAYCIIPRIDPVQITDRRVTKLELLKSIHQIFSGPSVSLICNKRNQLESVMILFC